jgi:hypothetical protein
MLTTLIKFVVAEGILSSVLNILCHNEMKYTKRQHFVCLEFPFIEAIVKFYEIIPVY